MNESAARSVCERLAGIDRELPDLELLVVFGSVASGRAGARSDVDVAVRCHGPADLDAAFLALAPRLKTNRIDLVDLRRAGPTLAFEIARAGIPVFEHAPGAFRRFQSLASRRYADTKQLRDAQRRAVEVFLEHSNRA